MTDYVFGENPQPSGRHRPTRAESRPPRQVSTKFECKGSQATDASAAPRSFSTAATTRTRTTAMRSSTRAPAAKTRRTGSATSPTRISTPATTLPSSQAKRLANQSASSEGGRETPDHSPATGYRYDGLYKVIKHYPRTPEDGYRRWMFHLVQLTPDEAASHSPHGEQRSQRAGLHRARPWIWTRARVTQLHSRAARAIDPFFDAPVENRHTRRKDRSRH